MFRIGSFICGIALLPWLVFTPCAANDFQPFERLRDTALVVNGKAGTAIVAPAALRGEAEVIRAAVKDASGVELPVIDEANPLALLKDRRNLIVIGNRDDNRLAAELYDRYFIILDARYPGSGGRLIRSAPHPEAVDRNLVFVGGSDPAGTRAAAGALATTIRALPRGRNLTLPWQWEIVPGQNIAVPAAAQANSTPLWQEVNGYYGNQGYFGWNVVSRNMALFYATGDESYAREFVRLAFPDEATLRELKKIAGETIENPKRPLAGSYHYNAHLMAVYWNLIEDHPFFTPELRRRIVQEFFGQYEYLRDAKEANYNILAIKSPLPSIPDRHVMYCALTLYTLTRYLQLYYPKPEYAEGIRIAENVYSSLQKTVYFEGEGGVHYWLPTTTQPMLDWALLSGMQHRIPRRHFEIMAENIEVLASGEVRDIHLAFGSMGFFQKLYYLSKRKSALRMNELNQMDSSLFRLGRSYWPSAADRTEAGLPYGNWQQIYLSPQERAHQPVNFKDKTRCFSLASLRSGAPGAPKDFLLLDGRFERVCRAPYHSFSILRLMLADAMLLSGYRSQLYISSNGMVAKIPARHAEMQYAETLGDTAAFAAGIQHDHSFNWERAIFKRKGRYALTMDRVEVLADSAALELKFSWEIFGGNRIDAVSAGTLVLSAALPETAGRRFPKQELKMEPANRIVTRRAYQPDFLPADRPGDALCAEFELTDETEAELTVQMMRSRNAGWVDIALDGRAVAVGLDRRATETAAERVWCGVHRLSPGPHRLSLTAAGESVPGAGQAVGLESIELIPPSGVRRFMIGFCDPEPTAIRESADDFFNGGSGRLLEITRVAPAGKQDVLTFFTLIAPGPAAGGANCARLAPNAAALTLPEDAVAVSGKYEDIHGGFAIVAASHLYGRNLIRIAELFRSDTPVFADWDFESGKLEIQCPAPANITLCRGGIKHQLSPGRHTLIVKPTPEILENLRRYLAGKCTPLRDPSPRRTPPAAAAPAVTGLDPQWRVPVAAYPVALQLVGSATAQSLLTAVDSTVLIIDLETGKTQVSWHEDSPVSAVFYWPETEAVIVGRLDHQVRAYDLSGRLRWKFDSEMHPDVTASGKNYWFRTAAGLRGIRGFAAGKFMAGRDQLFVGTASTVEILNPDGTLAERVRQWWGPCSQFCLIEQPNKVPAMLVGRNHNCFHHLGILDAAGPRFDRKGFWETPDPAHQVIGWMGISRGHIFFEDLEGKGEKRVVSDLTGLDNRLVIWDNAGKALYDVGFGPGERTPLATDRPTVVERTMRDLDIADLDGDSRREIALITDKRLLLIFDPKLRLRRCVTIPGDPLILKCFSRSPELPGRMVVVCRDGTLWLLDAAGVPLAQGIVNGVALHLAAVGRRVLVATDRELASFDLARRW
jgi:hypothetical protein